MILYDHCPHPVHCQKIAESGELVWDENALDMIYGRFMREIRPKLLEQLLKELD